MSDPEPTPSAAQGLTTTLGWLTVPTAALAWSACVTGGLCTGWALVDLAKPAPFGDNMAGVFTVLVLYGGLGGLGGGLTVALLALGVGHLTRAAAPQVPGLHRTLGLGAAGLTVAVAALGALVALVG